MRLALLMVVMVGLACSRPGTTTGANAPKLTKVVAVHDQARRSISDGAEIAMDEVVDFEFELSSPSFVYVFLSEGPHSRLAWGHSPTEARFEVGTYAPNWEEEGGLGLGFDIAGEVRLTVVASPRQLANVEKAGALDRLATECTDCGVSSTMFKVKPAGG